MSKTSSAVLYSKANSVGASSAKALKEKQHVLRLRKKSQTQSSSTLSRLIKCLAERSRGASSASGSSTLGSSSATQACCPQTQALSFGKTLKSYDPCVLVASL